MSDFAPGPYHLGSDTPYGMEIVDVDDYLIARVLIDRSSTARLMAASHGLLAALEGMECGGCHLKMHESYHRPCPDCAPAFAAIAAARGMEAP